MPGAASAGYSMRSRRLLDAGGRPLNLVVRYHCYNAGMPMTATRVLLTAGRAPSANADFPARLFVRESRVPSIGSTAAPIGPQRSAGWAVPSTHADSEARWNGFEVAGSAGLKGWVVLGEAMAASFWAIPNFRWSGP